MKRHRPLYLGSVRYRAAEWILPFGFVFLVVFAVAAAHRKPAIRRPHEVTAP